MYKSHIIGFGLVALASSVFLASCGEKDTTSDDSSKSSEKSQSTSENKNEGKSAGGTEKKLPTVPIVKVEKERLERSLQLPGELLAYQNVPMHAKVEGYVKSITVDRGSVVKKGQLMISIFCPELDEKAKEGAAKLSSAESSFRRAQANEDSTRSKLIEAKARLDADKLTFERLQEASKTPGAVAQNEVDIQQKSVESDKARVDSINQEVAGAHNLVIAEGHNVTAARDVLKSLDAMTAYLQVRAPFDGVITERNVHEGSIVAIDADRTALPMVRIQEKDILRLVVAVPEASVSGTKIGTEIDFTVPAFVGKTFKGVVARPGYALDNSTRTMPVELNVYNKDGELEPGMFATVDWKVTRPYDTMFVPTSAVDADLKGTFVIRVKDDVTERVDVQRGLAMGNKIEVTGDLNPGDMVALKATNELKTGTKLIAKVASADDIANAGKKSASGGE
jgi:membrane fusion protein, multidrug efflux system